MLITFISSDISYMHLRFIYSAYQMNDMIPIIRATESSYRISQMTK